MNLARHTPFTKVTGMMLFGISIAITLLLIQLGSYLAGGLSSEQHQLAIFLLIAGIILLSLSQTRTRLQSFQWLLLGIVSIISGMIFGQLLALVQSGLPLYASVIIVLGNIFIASFLPITIQRIKPLLGILVLVTSWLAILLMVVQILTFLVLPSLVASLTFLILLFYDTCQTLWREVRVTKALLFQDNMLLLGIYSVMVMLTII
jgi:hypothetical protein